MAAADMNGDGKLDLVSYSQAGVSILLGKGDGTFILAGNVEYASETETFNDIKIGDFNGDGFPDAAVFYPIYSGPDEVALFLGNGDGTLQNHIGSNHIRPRMISASSPQVATLANTGTRAVTISSISINGPFTQTNDCPASLAASTNCDIFVRFAPQKKGEAEGTLSVSDDATGSPQEVSLSGVGTVVTFLPQGVNFGDQKVGTSSPPVAVKLFNKGRTTLSITQITIAGTNSGDFSEKNNCGQSVPTHGHCTITVTFTPTATGPRAAAVSVSDDGGGSPQLVPLAGTGT